jgi:hypothetical protein
METLAQITDHMFAVQQPVDRALGSMPEIREVVAKHGKAYHLPLTNPS